LDLGIIKNIKHFYRESIVNSLIGCVEKNVDFPKVFVLDAIEKLAEEWAVRVKSETIFNCFKKGGFHVQNDDQR
jgi:hypothetical protein